MGKRQPDCAQLQKPGGARIENAARDVDVRDGVAVKQNLPLAKIVKKRSHGNAGGDCHASRRFAVPAAGSAALSFQVGKFAEELEARFDFLAGERLQTFCTETLHRERSHDAAIEEGALQDFAVDLPARRCSP